MTENFDRMFGVRPAAGGPRGDRPRGRLRDRERDRDRARHTRVHPRTSRPRSSTAISPSPSARPVAGGAPALPTSAGRAASCAASRSLAASTAPRSRPATTTGCCTWRCRRRKTRSRAASRSTTRRRSRWSTADKGGARARLAHALAPSADPRTGERSKMTDLESPQNGHTNNANVAWSRAVATATGSSTRCMHWRLRWEVPRPVRTTRGRRRWMSRSRNSRRPSPNSSRATTIHRACSRRSPRTTHGYARSSASSAIAGGELAATARSLREQLNREDMLDAWIIADVRDHTRWLMNALHHHRAREADLVFDVLEIDLTEPAPAPHGT